jgi:hypothetical protein
LLSTLVPASMGSQRAKRTHPAHDVHLDHGARRSVCRHMRCASVVIAWKNPATNGLAFYLD